MSRSVLTATVLLASAALAGCASWAEPAATPPATFKVTGSVTLSLDANQFIDNSGNAETPIAGSGCKGIDTHTDITTGTPAVIRDGGGKVAGVGQLSAGVVSAEGNTCSFPLTVDEVANGQAFYSVELAHRGQTYYTAANIRKPLLITLR